MNDNLPDFSMDCQALYQEEQFTDHKVGSIRRMTPVDADGRRDPARAVEYWGQSQVMTQVALKPGLFRDLYIAMGQPLDGDAWSIRVHVKPFIRWIWGGAVLMLIGGLTAASDRRYWKRQPAQQAAAVPPRSPADAAGATAT